MSWDKGMLIREEIKSVAIAIIELCLFEGISKSVNQSVENLVNSHLVLASYQPA